MSTCISRHGEFGSHEFPETGPERFLCTLCHVLAEPELFAALEAAERRWVCDSCMGSVARDQIADMVDGEHVLCKWCDWEDDPRNWQRESQRLRDGITALADEWRDAGDGWPSAAYALRALLNPTKMPETDDAPEPDRSSPCTDENGNPTTWTPPNLRSVANPTERPTP